LIQSKYHLLPPLPEQRRIVDKIEELFTQLDKGVEQLKAVQQQLRTYRQAVLKAAFEGKLTEDWRSAFASDLHSHFGEGGKASADGEKTKVEGSHAGGVPPIGGQGVRAAQAQSAQELLEQIKIERQQHYEQALEQWTTEVEEWEANGKPGKKPRKPRKPKEYPPLTEEELKELPELPEGWEISRLGNFADIIGGVTKGRKLEGKKTIELPYLRVANVQDGYLDLKVIKTIQVLPDDLEKYRLLEGDVLYTEGGDKDKLGRGTIWKNEIDNCIHQNHVFRARLFKELTLPSFIAYYSQTQEAKTYFFRNAKQTVNLASINMTVLCNLPVPIPPTEEQHQILEEIESRLSVCEQVEKTIEANLQKAEALRQSILKKAFEGKLVPQDPEEEPAGVLLERIRGEKEKEL
jgi:type I restriction enzyme S subunit